MNIQHQILGKLLLNSQLYYENIGFIKHLDFDENEKIVFDSIEKLILDGEIDQLKLNRLLKKTGINEVVMLGASISIAANTTNNFLNLIYERLDILLKSKFENLCITYNERIQEGEYVIDVIEHFQDDLSKLVTFEKSNIKTLNSLIQDVIVQMENNISMDEPFTGIKTTFEYYDKFSKGLQKSDLIIIAGETSQGKTSLAMNFIRDAKAKIAIFSLEMSSLQLTARLMSQSSEVDSKTILFEKASQSEIESIGKGVLKLKDKDIFIDEIGSNSVYSIISSIKQMKIKYDIEIVVIDYLQLVNDEKAKGREQEVGQIARRFKNIAKQLDINIILISQLNRDKHNPKPSLSRLRDSGQIEEAADQVIFIYRPEFYGKDFLEPIYNEQLKEVSAKGKAQIIIAKGRNIGVAEFALEFYPRYTLFKNYYHVESRGENESFRPYPQEDPDF